MDSKDKTDTFIINALVCPITLELFIDPVVADDGHTYERTAIIEWIKNHNETSPITRQPIKLKSLQSNRIAKQLADRYRSSSTSHIGKDLVIFSGNGTLLNKEQQILINELFQKEKKWSLIYKATRDGFESNDFHRLCNNRGATLTLIKARNRLSMKKRNSIFGGYTTIPWSSRTVHYRDPQAFLFLFDHEKLTRFNIRTNDEIAVSHSVASGPIFGYGDINICHRPDVNYFSYSKFPNCYQDNNENGRGKKTFSKTKHFLVCEIEIYMVIT
ncbi:unnamed protein product [Adineta steineri]|uniref:TLDc domain-containing protein n=1 Tax=Adineta steineri TaxID=433720 RepID=A0A814V7N6_9BILA|nr:unnamed protein product [Adineta steineri]CAF1185295.1 unnamed protein product [Adineta steineri]